MSSFSLQANPLFKRTLDFPSLSESCSSFCLLLPMRDGHESEVVFFTPSCVDPPWPCILVRSPYKLESNFLEEVLPLTKEGYGVVFQRTRRSWCGLLSLFTSSQKITEDTFDICAWLVASPYCNGSIGMWGLSASAIIQSLVGGQEIPGLKSLYMVSTTCRFIRDVLFSGDVVRKDIVRNRIGLLLQSFMGLCSFQEESPFFRMVEPKRYVTPQQRPTLYCTGWYDFFSKGTIDTFLEHHQANPSKSILIIGPWSHIPMTDSPFFFQNENNLPFDCSPKKWFDHHLKGEKWTEDISSLYYVLHPQEGHWKKMQTWPIPSQNTTLSLSQEPETWLIVEHDPSQPVPATKDWTLQNHAASIGQEVCQHPFVQKHLLNFEPQSETIITGTPRLQLSFIKTEQTSFIVRLCHISSQGEWRPLSQGAKKLEAKKLKYVFDCSPTSFLLKPGERLGLLFSSSSDPSLQHSEVPTSVTLNLEKSQIILPIEQSP
ncbi:CocE/NonD family hydrolase [Candidatus Similichlamydia laticola]|uniref:CocE/NonD family hydrolase n=1 Tax=Candidatus Similichlamydia laticola TaxID=2170265 RepID=UPI0011C053A9|nr:CocE/NonD family hydrolase [Candidatus Similichlamydia laticola]